MHSSGSELFIYHALHGTWKQLYLPPDIFLLDLNPFQLPDKRVAFFCSNQLKKTTVIVDPGINQITVDKAKINFSSGVYIYVIKSGENIYKGKLVIFND